MNRSESKYFHTARRMDEALITLLEKARDGIDGKTGTRIAAQ